MMQKSTHLFIYLTNSTKNWNCILLPALDGSGLPKSVKNNEYVSCYYSCLSVSWSQPLLQSFSNRQHPFRLVSFSIHINKKLDTLSHRRACGLAGGGECCCFANSTLLITFLSKRARMAGEENPLPCNQGIYIKECNQLQIARSSYFYRMVKNLKGAFLLFF